MAGRTAARVLGVLWAAVLIWTPVASLAGVSLIKIADTTELRAPLVPYLFGRNRADADSQTRAAGFTPRFAGATGQDATVVAQSVEAGQQRPRGAVIVLRMGVVEGGGISAPRLLGLNRDAASSRAEASGLKPLFYGPNGPGVVVASQSVPAGQQVARGTYIQLQMRVGAAAASIRMPDFANMLADQARALAAANRLRPVFAGDQGPASRVAAQTPLAGAETSAGAEVQLRMGVSLVRVPKFIGRPRTIALAIAAKAGLTLDLSGDDGVAARISQQTPGPGTSVEAGSHVAAVMATPAQVVVVPQLVGLTRAAAVSLIGQSNLTVESRGSESPAAVVVAQTPVASTNVAAGDVVRIVLSLTEKPHVFAVPDVGGETRELAVAALKEGGFTAIVSGDTGKAARVVNQDPAAGTPTARGSTVTITLKSSLPSWIAPLGVLAVIVAGGVGWVIRKRPGRRDGDIPPIVVEPDLKPKVPSVQPVTYAAMVDAGRPTVRFADEPTFAARALSLPRAAEGSEP